MKKFFFTAGLVLTLVLGAGVAKADIIEQWEYSVQGYFFNYVSNGGSGGVLAGTPGTEHSFNWQGTDYIGYSALTWGLPSGSAANSGVSMSPSAEGAVMTTNGGWYDAMTLRHDNNQLTSNSASLQYTQVFLDMALKEVGGDGYEKYFSTVLEVLFYETVNTGGGSAETDQDIFVVVNIADTYETFEYDGVNYEISFLAPWAAGAGDNPFTELPEWAQQYVANATGIGATYFGFVTKEWDITEVVTQVRIDSPHAPTPEPGTMLLMGIGLVGLGYMARKRRAS